MISSERQEFFRSRVKKDGDHLIWTGASASRGYGFMTMENGEKVYAHRISYCISNHLDLSDIEDKIILKTCDRNDCIASAHLISKQKKLTSKAKK